MTELDVRSALPDDLIDGESGKWEMVVGMEVHAQISSLSKLFSGSSASYGGLPNEHVSLFDVAAPGLLPVLNESCVDAAIRTGLGLGAAINRRSVFERKHYSYPDLPQGYQITQFRDPIVGEGSVEIDAGSGRREVVRIERLHLEQDAGKMIHDRDPKFSLIDLNRSGVGLMEIVSYPDMRSSVESRAYLTKLRSILRRLGVCDGNMEEGSLRADVNVSVRRPGEALGERCEIKNVNSIRFAGQAIDYESRRQIEVLESGGVVSRRTMLFDPRRGETRPMREKEESHDYRYFPDPDLLPLVLSEERIARISSSLPELPDATRRRFEGLGLSSYDAGVLSSDGDSADYFDRVVSGGRDPKEAANWITGRLFGLLNREGLEIVSSPISSDRLGELLDLISEGTISNQIAKDVFEAMSESGDSPRLIVESRGLRRISDESVLSSVIDDILSSHPDQSAQASAKPEKMVGWFAGQVMKATGGSADPQIVTRLLRRRFGLED